MAVKTHAKLPSPEQISHRLLARVEINEPPVQLPRVLSIWKNLTVVEEDLDGSGYLLPLGRLGAEIIVNKNDPEERKRFTIAHELGHWVLGVICEKKLGEFKQPPTVPKVALEKWCDRFATNLLMPAPLVGRWLPARDQPQLIDAIFRASRTFGVSEKAFFIRVWELLRIQVALLKSDPARGSSTSLVVDRNYADEKTKEPLLRLLETPGVEQQLQIGSPMIFFTLRDEQGLISVSGRASGKRGFILAVAWPTP